MEWISVKDSLPDNKQQVLIHYGVFKLAFFIDKADFRGFFFEGIGLKIEEVTHWMPLPPCPKD